MKKYCCYIYESEEDINKTIEQYLNTRNHIKGLKLELCCDDKFFLNETFKSDFKQIISLLKSKGLQPHDIEFAVERYKRRYKASEWEKIKETDEFLNKKGIKFGFKDMHKVWTIQEVETANKKVLKTANEINKLKFSPYEKLLAAYLKVTSRKYVHEDVNQDPEDSRSVFGVLNGDKIVCLGYAELLKAILREFGDENIKAYINHVSCANDKGEATGLHANLIIYIKDEKYGIDGYYYFDPTWDAGHQFKYVPYLNFFMVPLKDIEKIKYRQIHSREYFFNKRQKEPKPILKNKKNKTLYYRFKMPKKLSFSKDSFVMSSSFARDLQELYEKENDSSVASNNGDIAEKDGEIYNYLISKSESVNLIKTQLALKTIIQKTKKDKSEKQIYDYINKVFDKSCKKINEDFDETATNALVQRAKDMQEERQ